MAQQGELGWEDAREWLRSLPRRRNVATEEVDEWLDKNTSRLSREVTTVPRRCVHDYFQKQHKIFRRANEEEASQILEPPLPRFRKSDKWKPVWRWLESLDSRTLIGSKEIADWLTLNPGVAEELEASHSKQNLFKYIQKCYYIVAKKKRRDHEKLMKEKVKETQAGPSVMATMDHSEEEQPRNGSGAFLAFPTDDNEENQLWTMDKQVVKRRYELLCELQRRLEGLIADSKEQLKTEKRKLVNVKPATRRAKQKLRNDTKNDTSDSDESDEAPHKQRTNVEPYVIAWATMQAASGAGVKNFARTLDFLIDREAGRHWSPCSWRYKEVGVRPRKWSSVLQGWSSIEKQVSAPGTRLQQEFYAYWGPTWSAYSSNVAVVQPTGRQDQGVQKVLDVRFNPSGLPQIVCGCNAAPNELLVYDLTSGKSTPLPGHSCQVQAVEYACDGSSIVSCANATIKVWDAATAACVYTLGPGTDEANTCGHRRKISALAVHPSQSCLVATSGGQGDFQLLLWNVATGTLVSDLNHGIRQQRGVPSMDAMDFCHDNMLICGSDSSYGGPAVVQIWDIDAATNCATFPANATYITCLNVNPTGRIVATGSGDGTVGLFDVRSHGSFGRLPLGQSSEATSVSFSSCGRYIQASSTLNSSLVWDTRMMPMEFGAKPVDYPPAVASYNSRTTRPLHCLSHGEPMPTAENTSQRSGYVDVGDQGVNDARWFNASPVLVTASGNGSVAVWDVTLGQPCLRHVQSHSRCINTVAISPNNAYVCTGGDDQKLVLYESALEKRSERWRLTHPLNVRDNGYTTGS